MGTTFSVSAATDTSKAQKEEHKTKVKMEDLPGAVKKALPNRCPSENVKEIYKENENGKTVYEIKCTKNNTTHYIVMDEDGKLIRDESSNAESKETQGEKK